MKFNSNTLRMVKTLHRVLTILSAIEVFENNPKTRNPVCEIFLPTIDQSNVIVFTRPY